MSYNNLQVEWRNSSTNTYSRKIDDNEISRDIGKHLRKDNFFYNCKTIFLSARTYDKMSGYL